MNIKKQTFNLIHQNIQSIKNKVDDLMIFIDSLNIEVHAICLTEHWLKPFEHFCTDGFVVASSFCRTSNMHGGSCILLPDQTNYVELVSLKQKSKELVLECSAVSLKNIKTIIINVYRSPTGDINEFLMILDSILHEISSVSYTIVLSGDFNIDLGMDDKNAKKFIDLMTTYNLSQTIVHPTRVTNVSKTTIDNIFLNKNEYSSEVIVSALSDHMAQKISFQINESTPKERPKVEKRIITERSLYLIDEELKTTDWTPVTNSQEIDSCYEQFHNILNSVINKYAPKRVVTVKEKSEIWITEEIKTLSKIKRQLYEGMVNGKVDREAYKSFCIRMKKEIDNSKKRMFEDQLQNTTNKSKAMWDIVKQLQGGKDKDNFNLENFSDSYENDLEILNNMNNYFVNICRNLKTDDTMPTENVKYVTKTCSLYLVDEVEVRHIIQNLKNTKTVGNDEISVSLLKKCCESILEPLIHIINTSITSGKFPACLKFTLVKPIHKKGDKSAFSNYRPIALTSCISKVIEKIICNRMINFIDQNNIISNSQNGYIRRHK